jgi:hypothetical protein
LIKDSKEVAWNGIRFRAPTHWEIGRIDTRHILLEDHSKPAMEIKWGAIKGKFSFQKHFKLLTAQNRKQLRKKIQAWSLPSDWANVLNDFEKKGFRWQTDTAGGRGVILFCRVCNHATLIQFFDSVSPQSDSQALEVLRSFRDHQDGDHIVWAVFDIRAVIPGRFHLTYHQFKPGNFHLAFVNGRQNLHLLRWAPASAFLSGSNLTQFAKTSLAMHDNHFLSLRIQGHEAVEWKSAPKAGWFYRIGRNKGAPNHRWIRLWFLKDKNRILGIKLDGKRPLDKRIMSDICTRYEIY